MKKSAILMLCLTSTWILFSCQKEQSSDETGWNALTFTESTHDQYNLYMDEPHINLTFPARINQQVLNYKQGFCELSGKYYTIAAHNWGNSHIILKIIKDGVEITRKELIPDSNFAFTFTALPGDYKFEAAIKVSDNHEKPLKTIILHNSENRLKVY